MLAGNAARVTSPGQAGADALDAQLVLPGREMVVRVREALARVQPQLGKANAGQVGVLAVALPTEDTEAVEVPVLPSHRRLDHAVCSPAKVVVARTSTRRQGEGLVPSSATRRRITVGETCSGAAAVTAELGGSVSFRAK